MTLAFAKDDQLEKVEFHLKVWNGSAESEYKTKDIEALMAKSIESKELGVSCKINREISGAKPRRVVILTSICTLKDGMKLITEVTCPLDFTKPFLAMVPFNLISKDDKQRLALQLNCETKP